MRTITLDKETVNRVWEEEQVGAWEQAINAYRAQYPGPVVYIHGSNREIGDSLVWDFEGDEQ